MAEPAEGSLFEPAPFQCVGNFYRLAAASPIATETLSRIAALYRSKAEIRGRAAEERQAARQDRSLPVVEVLEPWFRERL